MNLVVYSEVLVSRLFSMLRARLSQEPSRRLVAAPVQASLFVPLREPARQVVSWRPDSIMSEDRERT